MTSKPTTVYWSPTTRPPLGLSKYPSKQGYQSREYADSWRIIHTRGIDRCPSNVGRDVDQQTEHRQLVTHQPTRLSLPFAKKACTKEVSQKGTRCKRTYLGPPTFDTMDTEGGQVRREGGWRSGCYLYVWFDEAESGRKLN